MANLKQPYKKPQSVLDSERILQAYKGPRDAWAEQAKNDDDFRNGAQYTKKQENEIKRRKETPLIINVVHPYVEQAKAFLTANSPRFTATGRETSDAKVAALFADIMAYIWDLSNGSTELKIAVDDYYVKGAGWMMAYVDPNLDFGRGEVCVKALNPFDVFPDPNSKDIFCRDSANILLVANATKEQILHVYPRVSKIIDQMETQDAPDHLPVSQFQANEGQGEFSQDEEHDRYQIIDRYTKRRVDYVHITNQQTRKERILLKTQYDDFLKSPAFIVHTAQGETQYLTEEAEIGAMMEMVGQVGMRFHMAMSPTGQPIPVPGPEGQGAIPGSYVEVEPTIMAKMVEMGVLSVNDVKESRIQRVLSIGGVEVLDTIMPLTEYPMVPLFNRHMRNPYPMSDVRFIRPIQAYINYVRSLIITHAANAANVKVLLPNGAINREKFETEFRKPGLAVHTFDAEYGSPVIVSPVPLPSELYQNEQQARADIQEILGLYPFAQGDPSQAPATYKGTMALDEFGQRRMKSKLDDIEGALNQLGRVVVEMIQYTYTDHKMIRLVRPNHPSKLVELNIPSDDSYGNITEYKNDITVGKYDVQVVSGSTLPNNRWARFETYKELYQLGAIDQVEFLKQTEVVDMDGVLERHSEIMRLRGQLQQMEEQVKSLQGDLQTARRESVHDRMRVEVEKFKSEIKSEGDRVAKATELYEARLSDQLGMVKQQLKGTESEDGSERPSGLFS